MLRALSVTAPVIGSIMIVVLLVEPPALRPAERVPALRVLTTRTGGLDLELAGAAIARGRAGAPEPYVLRRVSPGGARVFSGEPAGVVYTPFQRIAWAAHVREAAGRPLTVDEVPAWLAAPVVYVALRAPPVSGDAGPGPLSVVVVAAGTPTCCRDPQPALVRPVWVTDDPAAIARFGAPVPFRDLGVIAAYPLAALRGGLDVVVFRRVDGPDGPASIEMRGRLEPAEVDAWR